MRNFRGCYYKINSYLRYSSCVVNGFVFLVGSVGFIKGEYEVEEKDSFVKCC